MILRKQSVITRQWHEREIEADPDRLIGWIDARERGVKVPHIQDAFPWLSAADREYILNGITPEEWTQYIGDADD